MAVTKQKVKVVLTEQQKERLEEKKSKDCFVDGCNFVHEKCAGKPRNNKCAACRLHKNYLGIEFS